MNYFEPSRNFNKQGEVMIINDVEYQAFQEWNRRTQNGTIPTPEMEKWKKDMEAYEKRTKEYYDAKK